MEGQDGRQGGRNEEKWRKGTTMSCRGRGRGIVEMSKAKSKTKKGVEE